MDIKKEVEIYKVKQQEGNLFRMGVPHSVLSHKTGIHMAQSYFSLNSKKIKKSFSFKASHIKIRF